MIDDARILERLRATGLFRNVGSAAAAVQAMAVEAGPVSPAAYVIPLAESYGRAQGGPAGAIQLGQIVLGVVICVRIAADPRAEARTIEMRELVAGARRTLLGLIPGPGLQPLSLAGGHLQGVTPTTLWWTDEYATQCGIVIPPAGVQP